MMRRGRAVPNAWLTISLLIGTASALVSPLPLHGQELAGDVTNGKLIYELHCLRCHGPGGWGDGPQARELKVPPANFHAPLMQMKTDEQMRTSIEFGVVLSPMHGFRGRLSDQAMQDVVAYVRLLAQRGK